MTKKIRCGWCEGSFEEYITYHDEEWGVPVHDDKKHFEFLILEGAQAGLSWSTILKRRKGYRKAFANFDAAKVARFNETKIQKLLQDQGIIRNKLKVRGAVKNAKAFLQLQKEFGSFDNFIWSFVGDKPKVNRWKSMKQLPANSKESDSLKSVGSLSLAAQLYTRTCRLVVLSTTI
jgi:DNA-3-methyladenine glycosylase I